MQTFQNLIKKAVSTNAMCLKLIANECPLAVYQIQNISLANESQFNEKVIESFRKLFFQTERTDTPEQTSWQIPNLGTIMIISETLPKYSLSFYFPSAQQLFQNDWNNLQSQHQRSQLEQQPAVETPIAIVPATEDVAPVLQVSQEEQQDQSVQPSSGLPISMFAQESEPETENNDADVIEKQFIPTNLNSSEPHNEKLESTPTGYVPLKLSEPQEVEVATQEIGITTQEVEATTPIQTSEVSEVSKSSIGIDSIKQYLDCANGLIIISGSGQINKATAMKDVTEYFDQIGRQYMLAANTTVETVRKDNSSVVLVCEYSDELELLKIAQAGYLVVAVLHSSSLMGVFEMLMRHNLSNILADNLKAILHYSNDNSSTVVEVDNTVNKLIKNSDVNGLHSYLDSLFDARQAA